MTKRWIYLIVALMVMSACSKDDDNGSADNGSADGITGRYTGTVSSDQHDDMSVSDETIDSWYSADIVIKPAGENMVEVTIDQLLSELNVTFLSNVVSNEDGSYQFTGSQKVIIDGVEVNVTIKGTVTKDGSIDASLTYKLDGKEYKVSFDVEKTDKASENAGNLKQYEGTYHFGDFSHIFIEEDGQLYVIDIFYFQKMKEVKKFPLRVTKSGNSIFFTYFSVNGDWSYAYTYKDNGLYLCEPNSWKYEKYEGIDYAYIADRSSFEGYVYINEMKNDHETRFDFRRTDKNKVSATPWRWGEIIGDGFVDVEIGIKDNAFTLKGTNISGTLKRGGIIEYKINDISYKMEIDE